MRLRQRPPRALGPDWVSPRGSGRSTTIGNLDSSGRGHVDPAGLVTIAGATWSLDWWIGAEDRWHLPCREVAVRQSLVGSSPVVETRLRVPSGDAVHRAYAARSASGNEAIVIEVENQSKIPFAVALAVRPHDQTAVGRVDAVEVRSSEVLVDRRRAIVLPRSPGRVALSTAADGDAATVVLAGGADARPPATITCPDGLAHAALLFPLAHTATLRLVLPLGDGASAAAPGDYPDAAQVASGWATHASTGARVEVPDRRLRDAVAASTRHLLLEPQGPGAALALDLLGFPGGARRALGIEPVELAQAAATPALQASVAHWELSGDADVAREMVPMVAALAPRVARSGDADGVALLERAASLLDAAGERRAAADARSLAARRGGAGPTGEGPLARIAALLAEGTGTWSWPGAGTGHDPAANAALVIAVRELLVRDDPGLVLCPVVPPSWLGQGWELHGAPTRHGVLSYAVRWHGERPALLWELVPRLDAAGPVPLTAPGLDAAWSTTEPKGEALLSPVALPEKAPRRGITIPVTIESSPRRPG